MSFLSNIFNTVLPLYPGTGFPACPGGGVVEFPKPMQEAVIAEPDSVKRTHILSVKAGISSIQYLLVLSFLMLSTSYFLKKIPRQTIEDLEFTE